jgi:hypothetical protein
MPRRPSEKRLSSPPACALLPLSSVLASLALHRGALAIPLRRSGHGLMHHSLCVWLCWVHAKSTA